MLAGAAHILGLLSLACLVGGMIFFAGIMAPTIFTVLDGKTAAGFIRRVFPRYYAYVIIAAALAAAGFAQIDPWSAAALGLVALSTVWLRQGLMPHINRLRDAEMAGDSTAGTRFARAHQLSVIVNTVQLLAAIAVVVRQALS